MSEEKNLTQSTAGFFKKLFIDKEYMKDLKTATVFLFAYFVAFITNGFINDFDTGALISFAVGLGTVGIYIAITTVTEEGAQRGNQDAEDTDTQLSELLEDRRTESKKVNRSIALEIIQEYNRAKIAELKEEEYKRKTEVYETNIKEFQAKINILEELGIKKRNLIRRNQRWKLNRKIRKTKTKQTKLSINTVTIRYEPLEVDDFVMQNPEMNKGVTEKQRLRETPVTRTRRRMGKMNAVKTLFFYGFQGAIFASISNLIALIWFFILITLTLASTLLMSYSATRKYAETDYKKDIKDAIDKIKWLIDEQNKRNKDLQKAEEPSKIEDTKSAYA